MQSTHYQCSEKDPTFDFLNIAETSCLNASRKRAIGVFGDLRLGFEVICFGIHQSLTNQLVSMFTMALTTIDQQRSQRPLVMSHVHDHYI